MYEELLNIVEQRKTLEDIVKKKKAKFEEDNAVQFAQLKDLEEKEVLARDACLENMEKAGESSIVVEDKSITRQSRITKSIADATTLSTSIDMKKGDFEKLGIEVDIESLFVTEVVAKDKKAILEVADTYNKLTGEELEGINIKTTNFLTIKEK